MHCYMCTRNVHYASAFQCSLQVYKGSFAIETILSPPQIHTPPYDQNTQQNDVQEKVAVHTLFKFF